MEFITDLATPTDDAAIRHLMATNPMPGDISLSYRREPNYFVGCGTMGHFYQVGVIRYQPTGEIAGLACRSTRPMFVNGQVEEVGYLSQLRVDHKFRGMGLVSQGFHHARQLHTDGRVKGYYCTIIEGNSQAVGLLVNRPRQHFPMFREMGHLQTLAIVLRKWKFSSTWENSAGLKVRPGTLGDLETIVALLNQHGAAKQFFPVYTVADFLDSSLTVGFKVENFMLAWRGPELVGVMGLWNQSTYKQSVVESYNGTLGTLRPLYNLALRLMGAQLLPAPGQAIRFAYGSFICTANNDPAIFELLLRHACSLATARNYAYLMISLMENDPLLAVARRYLHIPYHSRLYSACWDDAPTWHTHLDGRVPYLEGAAM